MAKEKQENELEPSINSEGKTDLAVEQEDRNLISVTAKKISAYNIIKEFENEQLKKELPEVYVCS